MSTLKIGSQGLGEMLGSLTLFDSVLPDGVRVVEIFGSHIENPGAHLVNICYRQHHAGRLCAQKAMAQFGLSDCPIPVQEDGRPLWPRSLIGSITHTEGYSAAAVGARSRFRAIGIDAEVIGHVSSDLWDNIFVAEEIKWIKRLPSQDQVKAATLIFSAKEAFYKCQYEISGQWLEFTDVKIEVIGWHDGGNCFEIRPVGQVDVFRVAKRPLFGHFYFSDGLVITTLIIGLTDTI